MAIDVQILINEKLWRQKITSRQIKALVKKIIINLDPIFSNNHSEISILLTNDQNIQELNKNYRSKDQPTNVLSFPLIDGKKIKNGNLKKLTIQNAPILLGDIVIAYQTLLKESQEQTKSFEEHLTHLLIHSILHLIGYDHIKDSDAKIMENLEIKMLKEMGIKNPYTI